jgi:hypothetical protein
MKRATAQIAGRFCTFFFLAPSTFLTSHSADAEIFRCAGAPAMYTSDARAARQRGCAPVNDAATRTAPQATTSPQASVAPVRSAAQQAKPSAGSNTGSTGEGILLISSQTQKSRDAGRYELLKQELIDEQAKADQLREKLSRIAPSNPNHAEVRQSLERAQSNLTALQRELQYIRM